MHQLRWPQCCWRHPALSCHPEDEKRKLELDQGNLSQLSVHKGGLTWLLFEIHCKNKKKKRNPLISKQREISGRQIVIFWLLALCPNQKKKLHGLMEMAIWAGRKCPPDCESGDQGSDDNTNVILERALQ